MLFACGLQITDVEYALREAEKTEGSLKRFCRTTQNWMIAETGSSPIPDSIHAFTILLMIKALRTIITPLILSLLYQKTNLNKKNISNRFVLDLKVNINRNGI